MPHISATKHTLAILFVIGCLVGIAAALVLPPHPPVHTAGFSDAKPGISLTAGDAAHP